MNTATANNLNLQIHYHPGQNKFFFESPAKKKIIAKGRRWGLTRGYAHRAIEYLMDGIGPGLWTDTVNSNIDRYVERYFYPILMNIPQKYWKWRQQRKELEIFGNKLDMRSADRPELIEGFGYKFIMLNEAGIILRNEYLYYNTILPMTLDFDPDFYVGGTPKGRGLFFELANRADSDDKPEQEFFQFTSFENPYLDEEKRQELIDEIPKSIQEQEIYAGFLEDSSTVFRNIEACSKAVFTEPVFGESYHMGVDLAKHVDYTVVIVMNSKGEMVYMDRFNQLDWAMQRKRVKHIYKKYNDAQCWIDSTGVGEPFYEDLVADGLNVRGYHFTNESKKQAVQSLMISLEQELIRIFTKEDPLGKVLRDEMLIFEYEITKTGLIRYNAPEGYHDDCVIALALANWGVQQAGLHAPKISMIGHNVYPD